MDAETPDRAKRIEDGFVALLAVVIAGPLIIWRAWVLAMLWDWFVAPLGFNTINVAHAIGLMLLIGAFVRTRKKEPKSDMRQTIREMLESSGLAAVALGIGWLVSMWVLV